jgi:hypothetical protein
MNALLERLLWQSSLGQEIRAQALADAAKQEADLSRQIAEHEAKRDQTLAELGKERQEAGAALTKARLELAKLEEHVRGLHHRYELAIPGDQAAAQRACDLACNALRQSLHEARALQVEVSAAAAPAARP